MINAVSVKKARKRERHYQPAFPSCTFNWDLKKNFNLKWGAFIRENDL